MSKIMRISGHEGLPRFEHAAMATTFEFYLGGHEVSYLDAAAREAFALVDELEGALSFYRENSDVTRINRAASGDVVIVGEPTLACLRVAMAAGEVTGGAFDAFLGAESVRAKEQSWPYFLELGTAGEGAVLAVDWANRAVQRLRFDRLLDLGAVGKGHALDAATELFAEWGIEQGLLIAGGSSVRLLRPPQEDWRLECAGMRTISFSRGVAIGASGLGFQPGHIIDSRGGRRCRTRAWVLANQAGWADALSTAVMLLDDRELANLAEAEPELSILAIPAEESAEPFRTGRFSL